jgi:hypothetical protein
MARPLRAVTGHVSCPAYNVGRVIRRARGSASTGPLLLRGEAGSRSRTGRSRGELDPLGPFVRVHAGASSWARISTARRSIGRLRDALCPIAAGAVLAFVLVSIAGVMLHQPLAARRTPSGWRRPRCRSTQMLQEQPRELCRRSSSRGSRATAASPDAARDISSGSERA